MADVRPHHIAKGVALIIATAFLISGQDVVFKLFSGEMGLWQIFRLRGLFALPFISLATAGAGVYLAPIFVALLSAKITREPVGPRGWAAVGLGFAGVLVMLRPGSDAFSGWSLLPIFAAGFYATGNVITRERCQDIPGPGLSLSLNAMLMGAGLIISLVILVLPPSTLSSAEPYLFGTWSPMRAREWLTLMALALALSLLVSCWPMPTRLPHRQPSPPSNTAT